MNDFPILSMPVSQTFKPNLHTPTSRPPLNSDSMPVSRQETICTGDASSEAVKDHHSGMLDLFKVLGKRGEVDRYRNSIDCLKPMSRRCWGMFGLFFLD